MEIYIFGEKVEKVFFLGKSGKNFVGKKVEKKFVPGISGPGAKGDFYRGRIISAPSGSLTNSRLPGPQPPIEFMHNVTLIP